MHTPEKHSGTILKIEISPGSELEDDLPVEDNIDCTVKVEDNDKRQWRVENL